MDNYLIFVYKSVAMLTKLMDSFNNLVRCTCVDFSVFLTRPFISRVKKHKCSYILRLTLWIAKFKSVLLENNSSLKETIYTAFEDSLFNLTWRSWADVFITVSKGIPNLNISTKSFAEKVVCPVEIL